MAKSTIEKAEIADVVESVKETSITKDVEVVLPEGYVRLTNKNLQGAEYIDAPESYFGTIYKESDGWEMLTKKKATA